MGMLEELKRLWRFITNVDTSLSVYGWAKAGAPSVTSAIAAVWAAIIDLPGPVILVVALLAFLVVLKIIEVGIRLRDRFRGAQPQKTAQASDEPEIRFGSPRIPLDARYEPAKCWWHVPIKLVAPDGQSKEMAGCTAWLIRRYVAPPAGQGISLRWQSRDRKEGDSEVVLRHGEAKLVPVVIRDETGDGTAYITNENYLLQKPNWDKWPLPHQSDRYEFDLEIRSGDRKWRSPHRYRLFVPEKGVSNGLFTLELWPNDEY